jgi:hypothetical protein
MTNLYNKLTGWLAAAGIAIALLAAAYSRGAKDAAARQASARLQSINKARKVEDEIDRLDSAGVHARLHGWMRDGKR